MLDLASIVDKEEAFLQWDAQNEHDHDWAETAWEFLLEDIQSLLDAVNPKRREWAARVENFGWRKLNGTKRFYANDAQDFLNEVLPKTDNTFKIWVLTYPEKGYVIKIQNWHHDSPTGDEFYYIAPTLE